MDEFIRFWGGFRLSDSLTRPIRLVSLVVLTLLVLIATDREAAAQPVIISVTPGTATYGVTPNSQITIVGANFVVGATITVGSLSGDTVSGSSASASTPYVYISSGQLRFWWPNTSLAPGTYTVTVTNPSGGGTVDLPAGFTVVEPAPTVTSVTPASVTYGVTPSSQITIVGANFVVGATITVGSLSGATVSGSAASATVPFVHLNSGQLRFWRPDTSLAPGTYTVTVTNPAAAGGLAGSLTAGFEVVEPAPTVTSVTPASVTYGVTPSSQITITGANFAVGATITVGSLSGDTVSGSSASASTPFVHISSGQLRFWWLNTALTPGAYTVTVTNPAAAGGGSDTLTAGFTVVAPAPTVTSVTPASVTYGVTPSSQITIVGANFVVGATITVGSLSGDTVSGSSASASTPFVYISSGQLRFWWPNTALTPGAYTVTVTNPAASGGLAGSLTTGFTVAEATPTVTSLTPASVTYGITPSTSVAVIGSNFVVGATLRVSSATTTTALEGVTVSGSSASASIPFVHINSGQLRFWWPNASLTPGAYTVTVTNPAAAGGQAGSLTAGFTVVAPVPTVTSVTPSSVEYNVTLSTSVRIVGTNFFGPPAGNPSSDPSFVTVGPLTIECVLGTGPANETTPCVHIDRQNIDFYWLSTSDMSHPLHLAPGAHAVQVTNPAYAGSASNNPPFATFTVTAPQPVIEAVRPLAVTAGITPPRVVDIIGTDNAAQHLGFVAGATVTIEDSSVSIDLECNAGLVPSPDTGCVFVGPGLLRFYWDTAFLGVGSYEVTVVNPADRGGLSTDPDQPGRFRVTALPELISVAPSTVGSGARSAEIELLTAGFPAGSGVRIGLLNSSTPPYVETQDSQVTMRSGFRAFAAGDGGTVVIDVAEDQAQPAYRPLWVTITSPDGQ